MTLDILYLIAAVTLGAIVGSFLNVVILRVPQGTFRSGGKRSSCPKCSAPIRIYDNVPILSFLCLGARCRSCKTPISWRYPLVELLTAVLFGWLYFETAFPVIEHIPVLPGSRITDERLSVNPGIVAFVFQGAFLALLVASSFIDWDHRILPDALDIPGAMFGVLGAAVVPGLAGSFAPADAGALRVALGFGFAVAALGAVRMLMGATAREMALRDTENLDYARKVIGQELADAEERDDQVAADAAKARVAALDDVVETPAPRFGAGALVVLIAIAGGVAVARGGMLLDVALYGVAGVPLSWGVRCLWHKARYRSRSGIADFYFGDRPGIVLSAAVAAVCAVGGYAMAGAAPPWLESVRFSLLGAAAGVGLTWCIRWLAGKVFQQEAMGFGDVKFMGMIGVFVGWEGAILTFFLASLFGALGGTVHRLVTGDAKVPFGPFLAMGAVVSLFYQRKVRDFVLVDWPSWVQGSPTAPWIVLGLGVVCLILLRSVVRKGRGRKSEVREE